MLSLCENYLHVSSIYLIKASYFKRDCELSTSQSNNLFRMPVEGNKCALQVAATISASLDEYFPESSFGHVRIIAEPGRYFAASVFSLITNIIDKRAVDASVVTNDGSLLCYYLKGFLHATEIRHTGRVYSIMIHARCSCENHVSQSAVIQASYDIRCL